MRRKTKATFIEVTEEELDYILKGLRELWSLHSKEYPQVKALICKVHKIGAEIFRWERN